MIEQIQKRLRCRSGIDEEKVAMLNRRLRKEASMSLSASQLPGRSPGGQKRQTDPGKQHRQSETLLVRLKEAANS